MHAQACVKIEVSVVLCVCARVGVFARVCMRVCVCVCGQNASGNDAQTFAAQAFAKHRLA